MKLFYNKDTSLEVIAPNTIALLKFMIGMDTKKNYINLKQCATILYTLNDSIVVWNENEYEKFIRKLPQEVGSFYMKINANQKGKFTSINRNNVETLKNDFNYLCKLFTNILSSMIIDGKKKLFIKD